MRRYLAELALAAIAICGFTATPARAGELAAICDPLSIATGSDELYWMRHTVRERFPAVHLDILDQIDLVVDRTGDLLGPQARGEGEAWAITVPEHMLRRQCHMVLLQAAYAELPEAHFAPLRRKISECVTGGGRRGDCLDREIIALLGMLPATSIEQVPAAQALMRVMAINAMTFLLAHEAGHVITRRTKTQAEIRQIDEELEADLLAQNSLIGEAILPSGPLYTLASASLAEDPDSSTHDPAGCRLQRTRDLFRRTFPSYFYIMATMANKAPGGPGQLDVAEISQMIDLPTLDHDPEPMRCNRSLDGRVSEITQDLANIERAVRDNEGDEGAQAKRASRDKFVALLREQPLSTEQGKRLILQVGVAVIGAGPEIMTMFSSLRKASPPSFDFSAYIDAMLEAAKIVGKDAETYLRATDMSTVRQLDALSIFIAQPRGSSILVNNRAMIRGLEDSFRYSHPLDRLQMANYLQKILPGVDTPPAVLVDALMLFYVMQGKAVVGDCAGAVKMGLEMSKRLGRASPMTEKDCDIARQSAIESQTRMLGWVWDGPPLQQ